MTEKAAWTGREVELRACCGKLRWALLEVIESLPVGVHVGALRWGRAEIPMDIEIRTASATRAVEAVLEAAELWLGTSPSCYTGRGALVIDVGQSATAVSPRK